MSSHINYEFRWKNFKGFTDTDWIKIKPITILLGSNNSGKTNFIAPLLLMSQTFRARNMASSLIIKGSLYDGGGARELFHNYDINNDLFLGFRYHVHNKPRKNVSGIGSYPPGSLELTFGSVKEPNRELIVKSETIYDIYLRELIKFSRENDNLFTLSGLDLGKMSPEEIKSIQRGPHINFLYSPNNIISFVIDELEKRKDNKRTISFSKEFNELISILSSNYSQIRSILSHLSYIGPIRDIPHRIYETSDDNYKTVGLRGENMQNLIVRYYDEISKDLNYWVKKFGFGDKLELKHLLGSGNGYRINFKTNTSNTYTNIANAGFGASNCYH
jgi:hypothetical protein